MPKPQQKPSAQSANLKRARVSMEYSVTLKGTLKGTG